MSQADAIVRIRFIAGFFLLLILLLAVKLYMVQIVYGEEFSERAGDQYVSPEDSFFDRGAIYFTDKRGETALGAMVKTGYILAINPTLLADTDETYKKLSQIVDIDRKDFDKKAAKKGDPYEILLDELDKKTADAISALDIPGVSLHKDRWRYYPGGDRASSVLGFVGYIGDELGGRYGVEQYNDALLQRGENELYVNFFAEVFTGIEKKLDSKEDVREGDVILTIEPNVQDQLETVIAGVQDKWNSKSTLGIIMNPQNGEIYAMANVPTFNPNTYGSVSDPALYSNPAVEDVYEMGSIIKPLTVASGLDAGVITPSTTYNDKGRIKVDNYTISNYDGRARGVVDMQEVLSQSLNLGVAFIVGELGNRRFADYLFKFGLDGKTGIDLPNETSSLVGNIKDPHARDVEFVTASFGQGIAMSPIMTTRALSVLANGGKLVTPHVTKKIQYYPFGSDTPKLPKEEQVISKKAADEVTKMLVKVVDEALLGGSVALPEYSIAAKTGTAQIANKEGGKGYYEDRNLHSFFGYFPAKDPQFIVFLMTVAPEGALYASETLTYPFMDITKFLINYYEIPPDR